jgi:DNA-binding transcriptional LysR family regulator
MQFNGLDLNLLVVLDALLAERSITRAAERIHLSQSASSGALARLREFFKDELLVQVGHKMVLTPRAESLIDPVRNVLIQAEEIINYSPSFVPGLSSRNFRLMMSDYVATVVMPKVLRRLQALAPGATVELLSNADSSIQALERGEVDFLIAPRQHISEIHPSEDLFSDGYVCVVWTENPKVSNRLTFDEYLALGHVVARFGKSRTPAVDEWFFERFGHKRRIEVVAMSFNLLPQLVVGTTRVATMPESLARYYAEGLPVRILPTPSPIPQLNELIQWHRSRESDSATIWFRKLVKEACQELRMPEDKCA